MDKAWGFQHQVAPTDLDEEEPGPDEPLALMDGHEVSDDENDGASGSITTTVPEQCPEADDQPEVPLGTMDVSLDVPLDDSQADDFYPEIDTQIFMDPADDLQGSQEITSEMDNDPIEDFCPNDEEQPEPTGAVSTAADSVEPDKAKNELMPPPRPLSPGSRAKRRLELEARIQQLRSGFESINCPKCTCFPQTLNVS